MSGSLHYSPLSTLFQPNPYCYRVICGNLVCPALTRFAGVIKVISRQGMPSYRHHEPGDLYIHLNVKLPETMDPAVIPLLEQALPARKPMTKFNKKMHVEETTLEEPNDRQRKSQFGGVGNGDEMDEDDDERGPGGVQCAQRKLLTTRLSRSSTDSLAE